METDLLLRAENNAPHPHEQLLPVKYLLYKRVQLTIREVMRVERKAIAYTYTEPHLQTQHGAITMCAGICVRLRGLKHWGFSK